MNLWLPCITYCSHNRKIDNNKIENHFFFLRLRYQKCLALKYKVNAVEQNTACVNTTPLKQAKFTTKNYIFKELRLNYQKLNYACYSEIIHS